jgi:4-amino-4-deoxy-L-arabinose transferase-like glycosyltransferase
VGLCFAAAVVFRVTFLNADPPWNLTWSQALFTDGARAVDGARNKILFGDWILDMRSPSVLFYPLVNLLAFVIYKVAGVGLAQANLAGVVPGLASISMAYVWMRRIEGKIAGLIAAMLLSFCYVYVAYSRVPLVESFLIMMMLAAFWLSLKDRAGLFGAGFIIGLASFMVKLHALHMLPVVVVFLLWAAGTGSRSGSKKWQLIVSLLGGFVVALLLWLSTVYLISPEVMSKYFKSNILLSQRSGYEGASFAGIVGRRMSALLRVGSGSDGFFAGAPVLSILGFAGLICIISGFSGKAPGARPWERLSALWFIGFAAALSLLSYRPLRYMVPLTPALCLLATSFMLRLLRGRPLLSPHKPRWFVFAFAGWLFWAMMHLQDDIIFKIISAARAGGGGLSPAQISLYRFHGSSLRQILIFGVASVVITLLARKAMTRRQVIIPRRLRGVIALGVVSLIVVLNTGKFVEFARNRRYSIIDCARSLDRVLTERVFLVGDCATTISLETDFRTLPSYGDLIRYDEREKFEQYPITHFIVRFPRLFEYLSEKYPEFAREALAVRSFGLCGKEAAIVRYEEWPGYGEASYTPSGFETGMALLRGRRMEEAYRAFESFLRERPESYEALVGQAMCLLYMNRREEARTTIEKVFGMTERDALSYEIYGDILASLGNDVEARRQWMKGLTINPSGRSLRSKLSPGRR